MEAEVAANGDILIENEDWRTIINGAPILHEASEPSQEVNSLVDLTDIVPDRDDHLDNNLIIPLELASTVNETVSKDS